MELLSLFALLLITPIISSSVQFKKRSPHVKNGPFKPLTDHMHELKNIRIVSRPNTTITEAFYYKDNVYLAHGYYTNTCLCGESSSGAPQCQKYVVEPTASTDDKIPLTIHIFNAENCSRPASITYRLVIPSSGVSTVETDCDAGVDLMDLPYKVQIGSVGAYESFGSGELNLIYGCKKDCSDNLFSSYYFFAARKCGYGPEVVCAQNSSYEVLDSFSVRVVLYNDNQCDTVVYSYTSENTVTSSFEYSFKDQQCQALSGQDKSDLSNFNTVMFQP